MDYKQCECGGDIIMFTPDLDICKKCGKPYEPGAAPDLLKENQSLKLELQKQKELNAELVNRERSKTITEVLTFLSNYRGAFIESRYYSDLKLEISRLRTEIID